MTEREWLDGYAAHDAAETAILEDAAARLRAVQEVENYTGPEPDPDWDQLRALALRELEERDRELGLDLPPRNPGRRTTE